MINYNRIFIIFFLLFFLCASHKKLVDNGNKADSMSDNRSVKISTKDILFDKNINSKEEHKTEQILKKDTLALDRMDKKRILGDGFRVQVMVTSSRNTALSLKKILKKKFYNYGVYLIYKKPLYKIRIGDFTDKKQAERLRRRLIANGYRDSWVVSDKVILKGF